MWIGRAVSKELCVLAYLLAAAVSGHVAAEASERKPYSHHQGFEGECPTVTCWASNGESEVVSCGPTDEKAHSGKRSLKLDVKLKGGTYHYYGVQHPVHCAGRLKLTAKVFVAEGTNCRVGFGTNVVYPPTHHSGCSPVREFDGPTGRWETVEIDLVERGRLGADRVMAGHTAMLRGEDVGVVLDRWSLFLYGGAGRRVVVYVDDVRLEGEIPSKAAFERDVNRRWQAAQERLAKRVKQWRGALGTAAAKVANVSGVPAEAKPFLDAIQKSMSEARRLVATLAKRGYGSKQDFSAIESALEMARHGPATLAAISDGIRKNQPLLLYTPQAIRDVRFTPRAFPIPGTLGDELSCSACRGEYESVSLVVYALRELKGLRPEISELTGRSGTIPGDVVDPYVVKVWYQAAREIWPKPGLKTLAPELLLKDDRLVRVDYEKGANYLRSTDVAGTHKYVLCSGKTSENLADVRPIDAETLLPITVPARTLRQFWLTIRVPEDAKAGSYRGTVTLRWEGGKRAVPLELTVHPFDLLPSRLTYSIYYRARLSANGVPTIGSEYKSETQYRAEIADMKAHGVLYPTNYQRWDERLLPRVMEIRREVGLPTDAFYTLGCPTGAPRSEKDLARLRERVKKWVAFCRRYGYRDVYFYGIDEARGDRLIAQQRAWETVQEAGGKTFVACYHKTFESMGERLNCAVFSGRPDPEEAKKWHGIGSRIFCYGYPQVGNEEPERYRRNFGLLLWKMGYDGAMDYAYQHGFNHVWNDFDSERYRDHNFTYPTVDGVVGTVQWEGFREAVDDVRYMTMLERRMRDAPPAKKQTVAEAQAWLDALDPEEADLYEVRDRMVHFITALQ